MKRPQKWFRGRRVLVGDVIVNLCCALYAPVFASAGRISPRSLINPCCHPEIWAEASDDHAEYLKLVEDYRRLSDDMGAEAAKVADRRAEFVKEAVDHMLGELPFERIVVLHPHDPESFALIKSIATKLGLVLFVFKTAHSLNVSSEELSELEQRLSNLNMCATALGLIRDLARGGFFADSDAMHVFTYQVRDAVSNGPQIVPPADTGGVPTLPGMNPAAISAMRAQTELLNSAERATDVVLQQFLLTAAAATIHQDVSQSVNPSFYASLAEAYHRYKRELDNVLEAEEAVKKQMSVAKDPGALLAQLFNLMAEEENIDESISKIVSLALNKLPPGGDPTTYIPIMGNGPDPVAPPRVRHKLSQVTFMNRTGREIFLSFNGKFPLLKPGETFSETIVADGYPISAWAAGPIGNRRILSGRSFLAAGEGRHYEISVAFASAARV